MQNLKKFHLLDEKIEQTVKKIHDLKSKYETLQNEHNDLHEQLKALSKENRTLSKQIEEERAAVHDIDGIDKEEIRKRIDRVLEKFGELQL